MCIRLYIAMFIFTTLLLVTNIPSHANEINNFGRIETSRTHYGYDEEINASKSIKVNNTRKKT
jgi:hypothetical protein